MPRHTVTETELNDWENERLWRWVSFASSSGDGSLKRLDVSLGEKLFRVTNWGKSIYIGGNRETAIAEYNALP